MAYEPVSKTGVREDMRVQLPPSALFKILQLTVMLYMQMGMGVHLILMPVPVDMHKVILPQ